MFLFRQLPQISLLFLQLQNTVLATPLSSGFADLIDLQNGTLAKRCANPCGYYGQVCCGTGASCYTDTNNQAQCATAAVAANGYWQYYTTVYVATDTVTTTKVYSSYIAQAVTTTVAWVPATQTAGSVTCNSNQNICGNICCASWQYCVVAGQCAAAAVTSTLYSSYSAPLRPTSSGIIIVVGTATTTVPFVVASATGTAVGVTTVSAATASGGLSGGAIAGIVIGILALIFFLILLCLFCCFRAVWDALFGGGSRNNTRRRTEVYERDSRRSGHGSWYGDRPGRVERSEKKSTGILSGWTGIATGLVGLGALLGLKRASDRRQRDEKSEYSDDLSETTYSTESSRSDDRNYERREVRKTTTTERVR